MEKDDISNRLQEIYKRLEYIDADSAEPRAASILAVSNRLSHQYTNDLSYLLMHFIYIFFLQVKVLINKNEGHCLEIS